MRKLSKYQLVLQFPARTEEDFSRLAAVEDRLVTALRGDAEVDGHDFGSDEMNIFIFTDRPDGTFGLVKQLLGDDPAFASMRVAYRMRAGNEYTILWPSTLKRFKVS